MNIERQQYLNQLVDARGNGSIKVISGLRRCGKSYMLKKLFKSYLLTDGVDESHIILIDLENWRFKDFKNPEYLLDYVDSKIIDTEIYYILIDEVQKVNDFVEVLATLLLKDNVEIYVTGSNSKFLSSDIATDFRGRSDEIHMYPLSFSEFLSAYDGNENDALLEYMNYGGLPQILLYKDDYAKANFLRKIYRTVYLKDIYERHRIDYPDEFEELVKIIASSIGSLTNPHKLANSFKSKKNVKDISNKTITLYLKYLADAFLIEAAEQYDIKGKNYIDSPMKYYFQDLGLRNSILSFRQIEETHLMENLIFNELKIRGFLVDVGVVPVRTRNADGIQQRSSYEVDFVANKGSQRYYIQSAWKMPTEEKEEQESRSLRSIGDSFKKIIITGENVHLKRDESGITTMNVLQFLKNQNSLDL